jgi:uncharacterized protein
MTLPRPISWMHNGAQLTAMLHLPATHPKAAILMLPGGSDYRIGSHRSYVRLAQAMAERGHAVMRVDVSGVGDSSGVHAGFEAMGTDIASALAVLRATLAPGTRVFLWGQCDGASAILLGLGRSFEADGAILCNPWVRTARTSAHQVVRHHYRHRLTSGTSWRRLLRGQTNILASLRSVAHSLRTIATPVDSSSYIDDMIDVLRQNRWPCLTVIGSEDAGGQEFRLLCQQRKISGTHISESIIAGGNHSFSHPTQRQQLQKIASDWIEARIKTW